MSVFALPAIQTLCEQLLRGPRRLRLRQLLGIEFLLSVIEGDKRYPVDFVTHALTGFRAQNGDVARLLDGGELVNDLATLAEMLSEDADLWAHTLGEYFCSVNELADRLKVSTKTVFRWRKRGLVGWRIRGADRRVRLLFPERSIRRFVARNADLVARGSSFSQLTREEREQIVARAQALVNEGHKTVNAVARVIAVELDRAVETVRLILKNFDDAHPGAGLFNRCPLAVDGNDQRLAIWEAHCDGATLEMLVERFDLPAAKIQPIITEMRARHLRSQTIDFVPSTEFESPDADREILHGVPAGAIHQALSLRDSRPPSGLPPYLAQLFQHPLLTAAGEQYLFRRMNYLKYKADQLRQRIVPEEAVAGDLDRIEELVADAGKVKQEIVQANLRLVVGIAKRHAGPRHDLFELISDGNVSLMRAVDKFDYSRGFKFSTYASWAIIKNFARSVPEEHQHQERYQTGRDELLDAAADGLREDGEGDYLIAVRGVLEKMLATLDEREREILRHRFGLENRGDQQTLEQIGQQLGVSKERVRQLEARAIAKLRADFEEDAKRLLDG